MSYVKNPTAGVSAAAEITSGQSNERSADGGQIADVSVRTWRILLQSPSSSYIIQDAIGVKIGDPHPVNTGLPCVSFSERPDGDSRIARIVTATYRTTPGSDPAEDPNKQPPDIRPAKFTISSALMEMPAQKWAMIEDQLGNPVANPVKEDAINPVGDRYEGATWLAPIITISIEQFDASPTAQLTLSGDINKDDITFLGMPIAKYTCMLRSINVRPTVEAFGDTVYRGFTRTFEFAIHWNGWYIDQILEGFNIKNQNLNGIGVWNDGLNLEHVNGKVKEPIELAKNSDGKKMRAVVPILALNGGKMQRPSAQPVALNIDGTPRDVENANPPVYRRKYITQFARDFGNNFANVGVRIKDIV